MYTKTTPTIQTNDDRQTDRQTRRHTHIFKTGTYSWTQRGWGHHFQQGGDTITNRDTKTGTVRNTQQRDINSQEHIGTQ